MDNGWIKLHRKLSQSDMYKELNSVQRDVLIQCLLMANHTEKEWEWKGKIHKCQPGQFKTSSEGIRKNCAKGTTVKMVRTALKKLERWQFLAYEGAKQGRIITIINWDTYQAEKQKEGKEVGRIRANVGQDKGRIGATNKKDKNVKNEKKRTYAEFVSLTRHEYEKLVQQYGEGDTKKMISKLDNYKGAHGKTYDSDYRAILNWVAGEVQNGRPRKNMVVF